MEIICGIDKLDEFIISNYKKDHAILLYFGATWCGPCKQLKQRLEDPETFIIMPKLVVAYIDVDNKKLESLVNGYKIDSLPTQIFIKLDENKVIESNRIEGYDFTKLKLKYDEYVSVS